MNGTRESWTPERREAQRRRVHMRWTVGGFATRKPVAIDEAERAARSARMKALNTRMRDDKVLKRKCVAGQKRVRRRAGYRRKQSAAMTQTMARPELRDLAREHCRRINRDPKVRRRQWDSRGRKKAKAAATAEAAVARSPTRPPLERGDALLAALRQHHGVPR